MNWPDERYIKVYLRDTTDWLDLSWQAQGLFLLILRKVDRAGVLDLGRKGSVGLAKHVGGATSWLTIEPALEELLEDGCVEVTDTELVVPNFMEAQEAKQSDKLRQSESRSRRRAQACAEPSIPVTNSHTPSRDVTDGHAPSHAVTRCHSRLEETRLDQTSIAQQPPLLELETQSSTAASKRKASPAQNLREQLRAMRTAALPEVVDDVELKPSALTRTFDRLQAEATAKEATVFEAYTAYLQDDYARTRNPPCPLGLFVDGNKYRECLSAALRARGKAPPLTLVSSKKPGGYVSLEEIEAQVFTIDPIEPDAQEAP